MPTRIDINKKTSRRRRPPERNPKVVQETMPIKKHQDDFVIS